ncbi:hypothetical protein TH8_19505 [Thalassospira profundimaris]|nr:hypothetical protein TH8_19505 [Thalassospira profundimaris]
MMQALFHSYAQDRACPRGFARKRGTQISRDVAQTAQRSAGRKPKDKKQPKGWFLQFPQIRFICEVISVSDSSIKLFLF